MKYIKFIKIQGKEAAELHHTSRPKYLLSEAIV